jgi:hypothetical protein
MSLKATESDEKLPYSNADPEKQHGDIEQAPDSPLSEQNVAANLETTPTRRSEIDPFSEPPDGGWNAWLKVLGCFLLYSNIWYFHPARSSIALL